MEQKNVYKFGFGYISVDMNKKILYEYEFKKIFRLLEGLGARPHKPVEVVQDNIALIAHILEKEINLKDTDLGDDLPENLE